MMFAQSPPTPSGAQFMVWISCACLTLFVIDLALRVWGRIAGRKQPTEVTPQPLDVRMVHEFVRKPECEARHQESVSSIADVRNDVESLRQERRQDITAAAISRKGIYEKIEQSEAQTGTKLESIRRELSENAEAVRLELSAKIDRIPGEIIATLRNTGALRK